MYIKTYKVKIIWWLLRKYKMVNCKISSVDVENFFRFRLLTYINKKGRSMVGSFLANGWLFCDDLHIGWKESGSCEVSVREPRGKHQGAVREALCPFGNFVGALAVVLRYYLICISCSGTMKKSLCCNLIWLNLTKSFSCHLVTGQWFQEVPTSGLCQNFWHGWSQNVAGWLE